MDQIDAVLLDMIMPDLSGRQVLGRLRKIQPGVKILLSSGYSLNGLDKNDDGEVGNGFIQKPYHIEQLAAALDELLNGSDRRQPD